MAEAPVSADPEEMYDSLSGGILCQSVSKLKSTRCKCFSAPYPIRKDLTTADGGLGGVAVEVVLKRFKILSVTRVCTSSVPHFVRAKVAASLVSFCLVTSSTFAFFAWKAAYHALR